MAPPRRKRTDSDNPSFEPKPREAEAIHITYHLISHPRPAEAKSKIRGEIRITNVARKFLESALSDVQLELPEPISESDQPKVILPFDQIRNVLATMEREYPNPREEGVGEVVNDLYGQLVRAVGAAASANPYNDELHELRITTGQSMVRRDSI